MPRRDLTRPLTESTWTYPGDPPVELRPAATHAEDGYRVTELTLGTHAGTHVDAPAHVMPEGLTLGDIPVSTLVGEAQVVRIDAGPRRAIGPDAVPDLDADLLLVSTGWADRWGTDDYLNHPYLAPETARKCATAGVHVGIDAPSVDPSRPPDDGDDSDGLPAHRALLGEDSLIVENLPDLSELPDRVTFRAYPLAIDADGAPVRAVAEW